MSASSRTAESSSLHEAFKGLLLATRDWCAAHERVIRELDASARKYAPRRATFDDPSLFAKGPFPVEEERASKVPQPVLPKMPKISWMPSSSSRAPKQPKNFPSKKIAEHPRSRTSDTKSTSATSTGVGDPLLECCALLKRKFSEAGAAMENDFDVFTTHLLCKTVQSGALINVKQLHKVVDDFLRWHRSFLETLVELSDEAVDRLPRMQRERSLSTGADCRIALCGSLDHGLGKRYFGVRTMEECGVPKHVACGSDRYLLVDVGSVVYESVNSVAESNAQSLSSIAVPVPALLLCKTLWQRNVRVVACGQDHSLALTSAGEVFSWGSECDDGQLGHGSGVTSCEPRFLASLMNEPIVRAACGAKHSVAVSVSGKLFTWGCGSRGCLGHGDDRTRWAPKEVVKSRNVHGWSFGALFQKTIGSKDSRSDYRRSVSAKEAATSGGGVPPSPTTLDMSNKFTDVDCGGHFTVVLTATNHVMCFGDNKKWQCGDVSLAIALGSKPKHQSLAKDRAGESSSDRLCTSPVFVVSRATTTGIPATKTHEEANTFLSAKSFSCGFFHTVALGEGGRQLLSWGSGPGLGLGKDFGIGTQRPESRIAQSVNASHLLRVGEYFDAIACGEFHSVVVTNQRRVFVWGQNSNGCLGLESSSVKDSRMVWTPRVLDSSEVFGSPASSRLLVGCGLRFTVAVDTSFANDDASAELNVNRAFASDTVVRSRMKLDQMREDAWSDHGVLSDVEDWASGRKSKLPKSAKLEWGKGVPSRLRGRAWSAVISNDAKVTEKDFESRIRQADRRLSRAHKSVGHRTTIRSYDVRSAESMRLIDRDLKRTLSTHGLKFLFDVDGPLRTKLRAILLAFSHLRQEIGYVQGMSFVAAFLLINMCPGTFSAFRCFTNLALNTHLYSFYSLQRRQGKIAVKRYYRAFDIILQNQAPRLWRHFESLGIVVRPDRSSVDADRRDRSRRVTFSLGSSTRASRSRYPNTRTNAHTSILCSAVLLPWLQTVFLKNVHLSLSIVARIWDCWLLNRANGSAYLLRVGVAILKLLEEDLLRTSEMEDILPLLQAKSSALYKSKWDSRITEKALFRAVSHVDVSADVLSDIRELERSDFDTLA